MQRDRLEGWMVKQIQNADLAKETVIQVPQRATTAPAKTSNVRSPRSAVGSPRRRFLGHNAFQRPQSTPSSLQSPGPPNERTHPKNSSPRTRFEAASAVVGELDGEDSVARQWRLHFQNPDESFREEGGVNRNRVLKGLGSRLEDNEFEWEDDQIADEKSPESPLSLWGMPREYILEYIRQSIMPTAWTTHPSFTGEWEAVPPSEADGRYAPKEPAAEDSSLFLTSLPPLSSRSDHRRITMSPAKSSRPSVDQTSGSPSRGYRRPHPGATVMNPMSPRQKPPRCEERIHRVLAELRADPEAWEAFQKDVKKFLDQQRRKQHESNKIRENKQRAAVSPRAPAVLAERKKRRDERVERTQRHRQLLIQQEDDRFEAKLLAYRRRVQSGNQTGHGDDDARDITLTVGYRRRKIWLVAVAFAVATTNLQQKLIREKQRQVLDKLQTKAARAIQRLWKKWKWRHASKQTIVIYTWLRKCLWKLMFRMRCRRRRRHATILQRFMLDNFSGSRETRNFNRMMLKWRSKVIVSQRLGLTFVNCTRARLAALSIWWDSIDHERQRSERQGHDRLLPTTDEKEAEWNALVNNRSRMLTRRPSGLGVSSRSLAITAAASPTTTTSTTSSLSTAGVVSPPTTPLLASGSAGSLSRRSVSTRQLLDQMDERLTTMQQVLTPIEIQRLQQHAFHVVKVPKAIKMRLLQELLTATRKEYIRQLTLYQEQAACVSYAREVRLDDARAIVQSGVSWGSLLVDSTTGRPKLKKPVFRLFSLCGGRRLMEELVRRGVQLTLESDPEQRALVERQRQQRIALEVGGTPLGGSASSSSALLSSRKKESGLPSAMAPLPPTSTSGDVGSGNPRKKSIRKLTFAVPATIREKSRKS